MTRERKTAVFFYMRRCCRCAHVAVLETYAGCRRCRALGGDAGSLGMAVPSQPFTMRLSGRTMDRTICDGGRPGEGDSGGGHGMASEAEFGDGTLVCGRSRSLRNNRCARRIGGFPSFGGDSGRGSRWPQ